MYLYQIFKVKILPYPLFSVKVLSSFICDLIKSYMDSKWKILHIMIQHSNFEIISRKSYCSNIVVWLLRVFYCLVNNESRFFLNCYRGMTMSLILNVISENVMLKISAMLFWFYRLSSWLRKFSLWLEKHEKSLY